MAFEIRYYNANSYQRWYRSFVTEFPCFLGHPVYNCSCSYKSQDSYGKFIDNRRKKNDNQVRHDHGIS